MKTIFHEIGRDALYKVWNRIDGHMIIYMYSEGGEIVFHDLILPIKKGTLCYIGPDLYHYTLPYDTKTYDRSKVFLDDETFKKILKLVPEQSNFYKLFSEKSVVYSHIPPHIMPKIEGVFLSLDKINGQEMQNPADFVCSYFKLMTYIEKYCTQNISSPTNFISKAVEYINFNYHNEITLDEICKAAHISKHHLCRKFKTAMGMTVMEYILSTRIAAAKNMLLSESLKISEISEKCGFSSVAYFCQAFRHHTGTNANMYRKKKLKK